MTELYTKNIIKDIIINFRVDESDADDLEQEIYQILLEYDENKVIEMYRNKQLKFFLVGEIQRQYFSKTSPYYKKYKKYYTLLDANMINKVERNDEVDYD
jgi:hypothetical protein